MPYAGLDVHKCEVEAVLLDDEGRLVRRERFPCRRPTLEQFARDHLSPQHRVALEATTNTWGVVAVLAPFVAQVVVSNPLRTRAIAEAKIKTDRIDAYVLAQLLRCGYLPEVWAPDPATLELRRLTSRRASLVATRTAIKNRIHGILHEHLVPPPVGDLFGRPGRAWLRAVPLASLARHALDSELRLLEAVEREIDTLGHTLAARGDQDPRVRLLMTLPGVDVAVAQTLLAALGEPDRFRDGNHAASYLGLVPSTKQSAEHCYHGPITKQGKGHARWMLVQAAQHLRIHPGPLGVFFRRLAHRKNHNVAVVATARKLVVIAWHMLRRGEPYRYAEPRVTQGKLARLRVRARAARRQTGPRPGTPRATRYGSGQRTRLVPSLAEVYQSEGVPPPRSLAAGEQRMIAAAGLTPLLQQLHEPQRLLRRRARVPSA